jgi:hypothetical protein
MTTITSRMGTFYNEKSAASELRRYRQKGPIPSTRALIEALRAARVEGATLLDIGGGIGAIQHELLDAGLARATSVDASGPYLDASRKESDRRGYGGRVTYRHGDFVAFCAARSAPLRSRLSTQHTHGASGHLRDECRLALVTQAGARLGPSGRGHRLGRSSARSRASLLPKCRTCLAGSGLPPPPTVDVRDGASRGSEHQDLVCLDGPGCQFVHGGTGCLVDEVFRAQSASVQACAAAGKLAALACECLQHSIERVVAVRGLLTGYGAGDCITHEEDPDRGVLAPAKGAGEANGVEGLVGTVGGAVDDEQDLLHSPILIHIGGPGKLPRP